MCWASGDGVSPSRAGSGLVWQGQARHGEAWRGSFRPGTVLHGLRWQHGEPSGFPCRLHWWTRHGEARSGEARRGKVRRGPARVTDGGTESFGFPCHPHKVGRGRARLGGARRGLARLGTAGQGLQTAALGASAPTAALFGGQTGLGSAPLGVVRQGWSRHGRARRGMGCRQQHGASSEVPCCSHQRADVAAPGMARRGSAWIGGARLSKG
jgi:hypothetical protein